MDANDDDRGIARRRILLVFDLNGLFVERVRNGKFTKPRARAVETTAERAVEVEDAVPRDSSRASAPPRASSPVSSRTRGATQRPEVVQPDFRVGKHNCYLRRFSEEFLRWIHERFDVGVWSSAMEVNTLAMVENIWPTDLRSKIEFVLNQDHCAVDGVMKKVGGKGTKPKFLKPLSVVWEKFANRFDATNTLLIDDDAYKAIRNPENTAIHPTPFSVASRDSDDGLSADGALRQYLARLLTSDSVPEFVKANRFIDSGHLNKPEIKWRPVPVAARLVRAPSANKPTAAPPVVLKRVTGQQNESSTNISTAKFKNTKSIEAMEAKLAVMSVQDAPALPKRVESLESTKLATTILLPKSIIIKNAGNDRTTEGIKTQTSGPSERT